MLPAQNAPVLKTIEFLKDGNPANLVQFKFQDSRGFIWGADSYNTPMRFDGNRLEVFHNNPKDSTSPSGSSLWPQMAKYFEDSAGRIWITYSNSENLDYYDPGTERFKRFQSRLDKTSGKEITGIIEDVFEDSEHFIWLAAVHGVFKYHPLKDSFQYFSTGGLVDLIFEDCDKNIWLSTYKSSGKKELCRINTETGRIEEWVDYPFELRSVPRENRFFFRSEYDSTILLVMNQTLILFDPPKRTLSYLHGRILDEDEAVVDFFYQDTTVLLSTLPGRLYQYLPTTKSLKTLYDWTGQLKDKEVIYPVNIFRSSEGITWVLIWNVKNNNEYELENVQLFPPKILLKKTTLPLGIPRMDKGDHLFEFKGEVYGYTTSGLVPVRPDVKYIPQLDFKLPGIPNGEYAWRFDTDEDGNLWMMAFANNQAFIRKYDAAGKLLFTHVSPGYTEIEGNYPGGGPRTIKVDKKGKLWIATWGKGLVSFDPANQTYHWYGKDATQLRLNGNAILVDSENNIWCGTGPVLSHLNQQTGQWKHYSPETTLLRGIIMAVYEDARGEIWVATRSGLFRLMKDTGDFRFYSESDGIEDGDIFFIFEDQHEQLWVTREGLYLYDRESDVFFPFGIEEGVKLASSNAGNDYRKDIDGHIFLQSNWKDVFYFKPEKINLRPELPAVLFTDLFLFNKRVNSGDSTGILKQGLDFTDHIEFTFGQNDIAIQYTAPEYTHPDKLEFLVKLEGFHHEWQNMGNKREVRFIGLPPGDYTLMVKVRNQFHFESETPRTLKITILPPWYRTWWAYLLWAAIITGSLYWLYRFQLYRQLEKAEAHRLKELDLAKSRLYTNITHEFRTPLTVILGMAEQIKSDPKNWFNEGLQLIRRNGKQLLNLVNQLLDLSKLESGFMPLKMVNGDIVSFLQYLTEAFHSYADSKDIRLHFASSFDELQMDYDPEKMQNMVSNLLSNAIKFTPAGGDVYFQLGMRDEGQGMKSGAGSSLIPHPSSLEIVIRDNGPGISPEHLPHIFDRFYQADDSYTRRGEGTGIGLALVKELVKMMGGSIGVESKQGKGTQFTIRLPVTQTAPKEAAVQSTAPEDTLAATIIPETGVMAGIHAAEPNSRNLVLLVEDNPDVITYLSSVLSFHYQIAVAQNGQEGIDKAIELVPDLIVSDVMMPEKDGFELCQTLKTDERPSHIPIILLTAKADQPSKIEGLSHGADAYLAKPFYKEELLVRLEKLIELRRRLQERFQKAGNLREVLHTPATGAEDVFLQKVIRVIEQHMSDENFGIPQLCKELHMSRTTLFRKLKALTGKSAINLIRSFRLEKAKELLETTDWSISKICFEVGFNNPNYFSTVFREEFGIPPSNLKK